jgi:hypothetical protein
MTVRDDASLENRRRAVKGAKTQLRLLDQD